MSADAKTLAAIEALMRDATPEEALDFVESLVKKHPAIGEALLKRLQEARKTSSQTA